MKSRSGLSGNGLSTGIRAAVAVAIVVVAYLVFEFGRLQAGYNIADRISVEQDFEQEISVLEDQVAALKQEVALLETQGKVEQEAYQVVEANLAVLEQKIQEQTDAISFYRGILSPKDGGRGLRVQDLRLTKGKDDRHYKVSLVLVQVKQHDRSVKGEVDFRLEGAQDGVATTYALEQLLPENANGSWPFAFRYFQDFDRDLVLPAGFTPEKISVEVISRTKSIASVKQSFDWLAGQS